MYGGKVTATPNGLGQLVIGFKKSNLLNADIKENPTAYKFAIPYADGTAEGNVVQNSVGAQGEDYIITIAIPAGVTLDETTGVFVKK